MNSILVEILLIINNESDNIDPLHHVRNGVVVCVENLKSKKAYQCCCYSKRNIFLKVDLINVHLKGDNTV